MDWARNIQCEIKYNPPHPSSPQLLASPAVKKVSFPASLILEVLGQLHFPSRYNSFPVHYHIGEVNDAPAI